MAVEFCWQMAHRLVIMAVEFYWQKAHRSVIGFITVMCGSNSLHSLQKVL